MTIAEELNFINSKESYNVKLVMHGFDYSGINAYLTVPEKEASKHDIMWCDYTREQLAINPELLIKSRFKRLKKAL